MTPIELSLFANRLDAVCEEMGAVLRNVAFSPNIRDRLDYSCAVFDAAGELCAQAAHIPVHLGSMAFAMKDIVSSKRWVPGDMVIVNDPFLGGTHLPDVTLIAPVFSGDERIAFVVNRAHHADIGGSAPGSMPVSCSLHDEGQVIPPGHLVRGGRLDEAWLEQLLAATHRADQARGDFLAQVSANRAGVARLGEMVDGQGRVLFETGLEELNAYGERLARQSLAALPAGVYRFADWMDDDGQGTHDIPLQVTIEISAAGFDVDFTGTAPQVAGNINCPIAVTAAAVFYAFRCLMPAHTPACAGALRPIRLSAPAGSVLNARYPAAVAAGNVETSSRVVDLILGALAQAVPMRIPAASQGTMNNLAMGSSVPNLAWAYYETIGGGMGAGAHGGGWSGVQTHMTNTLNTPIEVLETRFPLRVHQYSLRPGSGGKGRRHGGDGLVREVELLAPAEATLLTERRHRGPWGAAGGVGGRPGRNLVNGNPVPPKVTMTLAPGDRLRIETPGGGGWGKVRAPVVDDPAVESCDAWPTSTRTEL